MQETNQILQQTVNGGMKLPKTSAGKRPARVVEKGVVYYDDTIRWPLWQSALLVVGFCTLFWGGVFFLVSQIV